jgi:hypothetical protein
MTNRFYVKLLSLVVIASNMFLLVGCAQNRERTGEAQPTLFSERAAEPNDSGSLSQKKSLEEKWGIKVESTRLSAGGYMVDFRYRVLDANKAAPILDRRVRPYLVDQASGATFIVPNPPKVGQLRSGKNIKEGKIYFIFFANPGRYVKSGNKVNVVIGDCKIENIVVH